jgi:phosphoserine phosphatase RsbU/P
MIAAGSTNIFKGLSPTEIFNKVFFWGMVLAILIIATICMVHAVRWIDKPFPGFLYNERMVVAPEGRYHWTGTQAGLKYPDKIVSANGNTISSGSDLEKLIRRNPTGGSITYSIDRGGKVLDVRVSSMRFTLLDLLMTFGITFTAGITYILIGLIVFVMKPDSKASRTFLTACLFLSLWSITIFDNHTTHCGFIRIALMAAAFFPAAFVHFSLFFPEPGRLVLRYPRFQLLPYFVSLSIAAPLEYLYPEKGFLIFYFLAQIYMIVAALAVLYPVTAAYFRPPSVLARQRAKVVLLGAALAFPSQTVAYFSQLVFGSFLGMRIQTNFLALPLIIFPASIAYAIAKHNLFDVDVYIKRAAGYAIMTAIIVCTYALVSIPLNVLMGQYQVAQSRAFSILFTLGVILVFNPLHNRIQGFVDRVFFRKEYDYGEIIEKIGGAMTSLLDLGQILQRLVGTFMEDIFIDTSSVMLLNPAKTEYQVFLADGEKRTEVKNVVFRRDEALMYIIEEEKSELTKYDVLEDPKYKPVSQSCITNFEKLHASLMVPLIYQDEVTGLLNLGEKKSGKFFSREDIDLIRTLANQGAVAIENARLFQENLEKQRMEKELAIARELQSSMLPAECPAIEGVEIAAYSISAREVGGDFYDFIEMGESKIGMVIGDVTGKSVSGALVMSASRSIFRMLSEEQMDVGEIMMRANRRTQKDIKTGMFVALLYAVINAESRTVTLCSAGQTQPIHWSSETGESRLIETKGDTFPLGIIEDAEYEETRLDLAPGDKVVLYTDGIVEAMNEQDEIFGFDRLLEVVQGESSLTADLLLKRILYKVNEFSAGAAQHDDLTIIVLGVDE